jgi:hypothetical protein
MQNMNQLHNVDIFSLKTLSMILTNHYISMHCNVQICFKSLKIFLFIFYFIQTIYLKITIENNLLKSMKHFLKPILVLLSKGYKSN